MHRQCRPFPLGLLAAVALMLGPGSLRAENYAFLVAVQDYNVKDLKPLQFTRNDILEFAKILRQSGFKDENIVLMTDKSHQRRYDAEAEKIRKQFELLLSNIHDGDTLVVAFSGHGVQFEGDEKNHYYCPLDADLEDAKRARLIPLSEIYDRLKQCPAEKKLLLVDACRNDPLSAVKKARQTVRLKSLTRPQTEPVPKGIVALFSCAAGQESYEWPDLKHGVFFHHVLEAWKGAADDGDRQLTLTELMSYATQKTQSFVRLKLDSAQTPQFKSDFEGTWVLRKLERPDEPEITNSIGKKLRLIPAGEFQMGSPETEAGRFRDEDLHRVRITASFYLGKYEVTRGEFRRFVDETDYKTEAEKDGKGGWGYTGDPDSLFAIKPEFTWRNTGFPQTDEHPVVNVTWNDAIKFCEWLTEKEGKTYRLPTEAEWEYACRGRSKGRYQGGEDPASLALFGNVADQVGKAKFPEWTAIQAKDGYVFTAPVGKFRVQQFGLHDMQGNVSEWCSDWADEEYYTNPKAPIDDPQGPESGVNRVHRGGSFEDGSVTCRSAHRTADAPSYRNNNLGFRLVRVLAGN